MGLIVGELYQSMFRFLIYGINAFCLTNIRLDMKRTGVPSLAGVAIGWLR